MTPLSRYFGGSKWWGLCNLVLWRRVSWIRGSHRGECVRACAYSDALWTPNCQAKWQKMSAIERRRAAARDDKKVAAIRDRGRDVVYPFTADPDDHCETSPVAYMHIGPVLKVSLKTSANHSSPHCDPPSPQMTLLHHTKAPMRGQPNAASLWQSSAFKSGTYKPAFPLSCLPMVYLH